MTPAEHAAAILRLLDGRLEAAVAADLARPDHPVLAHAHALADAADADDEARRGAGLQALFAGVVEPLNDGFTPAGRAIYARVFGAVVWRVCARQEALRERLAAYGIGDEAALLARHARLRRAGQATAAVRRVAVLSRVTIGADILLATVALQRLHQRYPQAELVLLGDGKLQPLLGGLPGVRVQPISYARRGPLRERLASWLAVESAVRELDADLVVGPDSRLDQLGLLPVCPEARYVLWENTQPEGAPATSLAALLDAHLARVLGLPAAPPCLPAVAFDAGTAERHQRLRAALGPAPVLAVKLDHGGNAAKALPRAGEVAVLRDLRARGWRVLLDRGFGAEELANSDALLAELGWNAVDLDDSGKGLGQAVDGLAPGALAEAPVVRFHGSIAGWAAAAACARAALSYDSVGHHLAGALGVPVTVAFTGFADPAFPVAWSPRSSAPVRLVLIPTGGKADPDWWRQVAEACPSP